MPSHSINFEVRRSDTIEFPSHLLTEGRYEFVVGEDGSIEIKGNRDGLLYLAEVLVRFALGGYEADFHAHMPMDSQVGGPNIDNLPELTIFGPSDK